MTDHSEISRPRDSNGNEISVGDVAHADIPIEDRDEIEWVSTVRCLRWQRVPPDEFGWVVECEHFDAYPQDVTLLTSDERIESWQRDIL